MLLGRPVTLKEILRDTDNIARIRQKMGLQRQCVLKKKEASTSRQTLHKYPASLIVLSRHPLQTSLFLIRSFLGRSIDKATSVNC